jgi:hypothetical protein
MRSQHTLALLLWRLRRESALYLFGAGASAPLVPMAPALLLATAASYIHLGSYPTELSPQTVLTERIQEAARGHDFWGRSLRPGTDDFPTMEVLARLGHGGALAHYIHQLAGPRFAHRRIPNYTVLRHFRRSLLITWNMDGMARDICGDWHRVIDTHGDVPAEYGGDAGAEWARVVQEYRLEVTGHCLHPIGPERLDDEELERKLRAMQESKPAFVLIVGYSFGQFNGRCDDQLALATFIDRFRDVPIDIYVCAPHPGELVGMLGEELRSDRVHGFPVYWNVLAWAFERVLAGKMDAAHLDYVHSMTLDTRGPGFLPEGKPDVHLK